MWLQTLFWCQGRKSMIDSIRIFDRNEALLSVLRLFVSVSFTLVSISIPIGCLPPGFDVGGGGRVHTPPAGIVAGERTPLKIGFTTWGDGSGSLDSRYQHVRLFFKTNLNDDYKQVKVEELGINDDYLWFRAELPPMPNTVGEVDYFFEYSFDGRHIRDDTYVVPVETTEPLEPDVQNPQNL